MRGGAEGYQISTIADRTNGASVRFVGSINPFMTFTTHAPLIESNTGNRV
jgi:hypothetical protein